MSSPRPEQPRLRLKDRRRRLQWVKVAAGTSVVALALGGIFYVAHLPAVTISRVAVSGTVLAPTDGIQTLVEQDIAGSYGFLLPRANVLLIPVKTIEKGIESAYPPVASVAVSIENFHTLHVAVVERKTAAVWCSGVPTGEISADGNTATSSATSNAAPQCYLMDPSGFIFAAATDTAPYESYYGAVSGNPIGATYLAGGFASLRTTVDGVGTSINQTPTEVLVDNNLTDVSVALAEGGVVRFTRSTDTQSTITNIASVFASQSFVDHPHFEYADFRFGDKVYVKFK